MPLPRTITINDVNAYYMAPIGITANGSANTGGSTWTINSGCAGGDATGLIIVE
jgi:hypothetical protein